MEMKRAEVGRWELEEEVEMNWMGISKDKKRNIFYILPPFMQTPE